MIRRELIYLWYYMDTQFWQLFPYWALGILLGVLCFGLSQEDHPRKPAEPICRRIPLLGDFPCLPFGCGVSSLSLWDHPSCSLPQPKRPQGRVAGRVHDDVHPAEPAAALLQPGPWEGGLFSPPLLRPYLRNCGGAPAPPEDGFLFLLWKLPGTGKP